MKKLGEWRNCHIYRQWPYESCWALHGKLQMISRTLFTSRAIYSIFPCMTFQNYIRKTAQLKCKSNNPAERFLISRMQVFNTWNEKSMEELAHGFDMKVPSQFLVGNSSLGHHIQIHQMYMLSSIHYPYTNTWS